MPNLRLRAELSVVLILMIAGRVSAQTQTAASSVSTTTAPNATLTDELKAQKESSAALGDGAEAPHRLRTRTVLNGPKSFEETSESSVKETAPPLSSPQSTTEDDWHFQFTPYFWLASLFGTAGIGNLPAKVNESFGDVFHALDFVFMGTFEARKGRLMSLTDLEYVSVSDEKATPGPLFSTAEAKFKLFIFDPEVGYRVFNNAEKDAFVDVLGGVRVSRVSTDLIFNPGILAGFELNGSRTWVDGVGGLRFKAPLTTNAFVTGKGDLGGGGSKFTYQLFGGIGYSLSKKITLIGGYRFLHTDYNKNGFLYDMNQRGSILGLGIKF